MAKLISVAPFSGYKLQLKFADGVEGEVDLSHLVGKGVFSAWADVAAFDAVALGDHGEVRWNDDIDLCADALYL